MLGKRKISERVDEKCKKSKRAKKIEKQRRK